MKKLRVAIIACGFTGQQHVEAVRRIPGTEVVAISDTNPELLRKKAEALGIENTFDDYKAMIDLAKPDIVHNCTPNAMHFETNKYVMKKGIHVYCEKPLAVSKEQGIELVKIAKSLGIATGVNFNYRHNAMVQEIRQLIKNGDAGQPMLVHGQYLQDWLMYDTDYNWRLASEIGGASRAVADIGSHWFDTAQCVLDRKIEAVWAKLITVHPTRKKPRQEVETFVHSKGEYDSVTILSEDVGFIIVRFEGNLFGNLILSQVSGGHKNNLRIEVDAQRYSMQWKQENSDCLYIGTRENGTRKLQASPDTVHESIMRYATLPGGHSVAWSDALRNGIGEFYSAVRAGSYAEENRTYADFNDGLELIKLTEACILSNQIGNWVEIRNL